MRYGRLSMSLCAALASASAACHDASEPTSPRLAPSAIASAAASNGGAPAPSGFDLVTDEICPGIDLHLEASGKAKTLGVGKAGAVTIFLSPGQDARLTNLSTGKSVTVSISGAFHETVTDNGTVVTVITGRNLTFDPEADVHFALTDGVFSFAFDADGNLVEPRAGKGRIVDACALVS